MPGIFITGFSGLSFHSSGSESGIRNMAEKLKNDSEINRKLHRIEVIAHTQHSKAIEMIKRP